MSAIELCRTAALGGHVERCADCAHTRVAYNSCRNRHCPKCQWAAAEAWLRAREAELLPVPYFHVVFTLPAALGGIAYQNKAKVYGLLLKAAAEALTTIAADPRLLGARIGVAARDHPRSGSRTEGLSGSQSPRLELRSGSHSPRLGSRSWRRARERPSPARAPRDRRPSPRPRVPVEAGSKTRFPARSPGQAPGSSPCTQCR